MKALEITISAPIWRTMGLRRFQVTVLFLVVLWPVELLSQSAPTVTTNSASTVEATIATLNGTVNPNGATTEARFNYGTTGSYGSQTSVDTIEARSAAFYFDGSTAALDNQPNGGLFEYTSFTIEAWAKRYPNGNSEIILGDGNYASTDQMLQFGFKDSASGNVFTFSFYNDDLNSAAGYTDTLWHQWVGVYDEGANVRTLY
ncbi:MAG TPA: hypothetical protein VFO86_08385, partial [Terriglobia bacterium]|nr:hypothetical protein [Terriglobia bacterium]